MRFLYGKQVVGDERVHLPGRTDVRAARRWFVRPCPRRGLPLTAYGTSLFWRVVATSVRVGHL